MLDVASHIVSDDRLGEPRTNYDLFELLTRNGWVPVGQAPTLRKMVGFRNILVHGYTAVDPGVLSNVVTDHLGDMDQFVDAVRARLRDS
jgi:uncharacterized protein YutE (UPF0331/DUF86 family)